jgi:hypothetical protein
MYKALAKCIEITEVENYKSGCRHFYQSPDRNCVGRNWLVLQNVQNDAVWVVSHPRVLSGPTGPDNGRMMIRTSPCARS